MIWRKGAVFILLFIFTVPILGQKNTITLQDGGYSNVLIAIDKQVEEDTTILDNLKSMFTDGSARLYNASRRHVYWKEIKILVPSTWSRNSQYEVASTESFPGGNMWVRNGDGSAGSDEPIVDYLGGCGMRGLAMHMTPKFIKDIAYREDKYGPTDKVLVRTWAYYRWGLFKEHYEVGDDNTAPGYDVPSGEEGTRCSSAIKGRLQLPNGLSCQWSDPNCRFVPDENGQRASASLLYGTTDQPHIDSIDEFCDDDPSNPDSMHNPLAPNLMNQYCHGDSAWTVMWRDPDFRDGEHVIYDTTPTFIVMQQPVERSVVLVLDISGSMRGNRFDSMIMASNDYIRNIIPDNSLLGIVEFHTYSQIRSNLTLIDDATRQGLVNVLPSSTTGSTCIGCGILSGIDVLDTYSQGGYMILLSDGGENVSPYIRDTYAAITASGMIIDTITISNAADQQMEDLSKTTAGKSFTCSDTDTVTCLTQAFTSTVADRPDVGAETVPVQIYTSGVIVPPSPGTVNIPFFIDAALGNATVISAMWSSVGRPIAVEVSGPDGTSIDQGDSRYHVEPYIKTITIKLPTAQPGLWNITIANNLTNDEYTSISVQSKPSSTESKYVTVGVILGSQEVDFSSMPALAIYAQIRQDFQPVVNAYVNAIISDSFGTTTTVQLLDNGAGSDLFRDDGTYSGFFLAFTSNGRYNVKVDAVGFDTTLQGGHPVQARDKRSPSPDPAPSFMRTASGGVFKVQSYNSSAPDILVPSRIHDLAYSSFSFDDSTVTLTWTAVGDDLDQGTAFKYDLRYSRNFSVIRYDFESGHEVTQAELVCGNLSDVASAGVSETVVVKLPERGEDVIYFFGIRAWDEAGNAGDLSNTVSVSIRFTPQASGIPQTVTPNITTDMTTPELTTGLNASELATEGSRTGPNEPEHSTTEYREPEQTTTATPADNTPLIIGVSCAIGVVVIGGASITTVLLLKKHKKKKNTVNSVTPPVTVHSAGEPADVAVIYEPMVPVHVNPTFSES